jgi:large subunit ribosomal protein L13e
MKHNNVVPNVHLRKHWGRFVKSWFNQPAHKKKRAMKRQAKATRIFPRPMQKLRPLVHGQTRKYASKIRYGRGFTLLELDTAKVSPAFARTIGISVDNRRRDTNQETLQSNVARLESYKSKLILFPRRTGKPKKGEVADSTAEAVASAGAKTQNNEHFLMKVRDAKPRQKFVKLTAEMKAAKCFMKIRQAQTNKRYTGAREKRAKDEAGKLKV